MSFLADLLGSLVGEAAADSASPHSDRGRVLVWLCVGVVLLAATGWLLANAPKPLQEPAWGFGVLVGDFVFAPVFAILCGAYATRQPHDRVLGVTGALANGAAAILGIAALF